MPYTLLQTAAMGDSSKLRSGVLTLISERSPLMERFEWENIKGSAYRYDVETSLPGIAFRAVGDTYPQSTHMTQQMVETLAIAGGEVYVDRFQIATQNKVDVKKAAFKAKSRAASLMMSEWLIEGSSQVNNNSFDGVRVRLGNNQQILAGTNGANLTLDMLDQLCDTVIGSGNGKTVFLLNKTLRRKITALSRNLTLGGHALIDLTSKDNFGRQIMMYNGIPLTIIENDHDEATFLNFDETAGSSNITASIYLMRPEDPYILGLTTGENGISFDVKDFGEIPASPGHLGRLEFYIGMAILHPRAAARLRGVLNG